MKLVLLALGALIALGGGAAGAYFYFMKPAEASAVEKFDEHADAGKDDGESNAAYYEYLELDPLILPIVDDTGVTQTISMVVALEMKGASAKTRAQDAVPKLKDAFIQDMYGALNKHAALKGGVVQVNMLKKRLNRVSKKVLGEDQVNGVLIQVVQQRPI